MKKTNIVQNHFSVSLPNSIDNYLALTFTDENHAATTFFVKFPIHWVFWDERFRYYVPSLN